ncbi:hypothetical protein CK203_055891 [Vitis vinifera]|uniref:Uncharacterized protein n=1 Tax=Vitis vinifera TaxID=29760 RepID=A0A438FTY2_VITVI|nr:hypothetical protein CK203_055891 [Vitis vinifera]
MGSDIVFYSFYVDRITCLMRDDSMSLVFPDLSHVRCRTGAYSVSEDLYGSSQSGPYREPSSQARALRCLDVVTLPSEGRFFDMWVPRFPASSFQWGTYQSWRRSFSHMSITASITRPRYIVFASLTIIPELFIDMSSQWSVVRDSYKSSSSLLSFGVQSYHRFSDRHSESHPRFDVQSHHHHFSVSAFRAIIGFQIDVQSRYHSSASVFRAIVITVFSDRRSESHPRFRRLESLSLLSLPFRVIIITSQFRRSESSSVFRSTFRVVITSQLRHSEPSSVFRSTFRVASSVSAFRVVITPQLRCSEPSSSPCFSSTFRAIIESSSSLLSFGVQSYHRFSDRHSESHPRFDVQSHHHHFSVSAFRAIIGFQIDVQSRYHSSASVFRAIVITVFSDRRSESHPRFRRLESLSLLSLPFRVIIITSQFRRSESSSVFRSTFRVVITSQLRHSEPSSVFRSTFRVASSVSAFRVVITPQLRCLEPSSSPCFQFDVQSHHRFSDRHSESHPRFDVQSHHHHFSVSAFRAIIGFQIDIQSRYHFSASAFRAIIGFSDRHSESRPRFRRSESLSLLSFGVQSHRHHRVFSSTFRAIIESSSSLLSFGVQSYHRFSDRHSESHPRFDVQSHHHHFSVSAFRAIIGFQIDVQSRYHSSASVFRAIVIIVFSDRRSESHPRFRRLESLSLLSLPFRVIIITSQFRRSESSSVFRSTFRVVITSQLRHSEPSSVFRSTFRVASSVSAFRVVITPQLRCLEPSSSPCFQFDVQSHHRFSDRHSESRPRFRRSESLSLLSFGVQSHRHHRVFSSTFRAIIGFQIDIQSHILGFGVQSRYHFSVWRPESLSSSCLGFQSPYRHLV